MFFFSRERSQYLSNLPSQLDMGANQSNGQMLNGVQDPLIRPETVNGPRIGGSGAGICIPELPVSLELWSCFNHNVNAPGSAGLNPGGPFISILTVCVSVLNRTHSWGLKAAKVALDSCISAAQCHRTRATGDRSQDEFLPRRLITSPGNHERKCTGKRKEFRNH